MIEVGLGHYLSLGAIIFFLGTLGIFLNRKNVIVILMSIELILLAVNINLISFSIFSGIVVRKHALFYPDLCKFFRSNMSRNCFKTLLKLALSNCFFY